MAIEWHHAHWGVSAQAYDGNYLVGQAVRYDVAPPGRCEVIGQEYRAFLRGDPVNGPVPTLEDAQALIEAAHRSAAHRSG